MQYNQYIIIMPTNKNAQLRYKILDRCFSNFKHKYTIDELVDEVNESLSDLTGKVISLRQIRDDIKYMRDRVYYNAPIKAYPFGSGRQCYYRYEDPDFSIFDNELSEEEVNNLRSTIDMLGKFRGTPANVWLEEVISNLEYRFNIKPNTESLIAFENNEQLKGLEYLSSIIDMTIHHQPVIIHYRSFKGKEQNAIIHPYYVKQYNNRWFVLGYNEKYHSLSIYALDRLLSLKKADITFIKNDNINFKTYFDHIIGVTLLDEQTPIETFILRFNANRFPYVLSKPLHSSQEIVNIGDHTISIKVKPNNELRQLIYSFIPDIEVISPTWFREEIKQKIEENLKKYLTVRNDCIDK